MQKKKSLILAFISLFTGLLFGLVHPAHGAPFPIATSTGAETGISAAFDGTNYLVGIQGDATKDNNITAQLVSPSGTLIGSRISVPRTDAGRNATGGAPKVAFDGTNYLIIWADDHYADDNYHPDGYDVQMGHFISKAGTLVGSSFVLGSSLANAYSYSGSGAVIFDGTNYFVVWERRTLASDGESADIYGQFISPAGALVGSAISVSTAVNGQRDPALAFDGTKILVVWSDGRNESACGENEKGGTSCFESDIYGQLITKSSSGTAGSLSGSNFLINAGTLPRDGTAPSIAFDGTNYFIVFTEETTFPGDAPDGVETWNIYGQRVTTAGAALGGTISIKTDGNSFYAGVSFDGTKYLVAWNDRTNDTDGDGTCDAGEGTCWDVYGQIVSKSGTLSGSKFIINNAAGNQLGSCGAPTVNGKLFCIIDTGFDFSADTWGDVYGLFLNVPKNDFNTDGTSDILWRNTTTGQNLLWYMDGSERDSYAYLVSNTDQAWKIVGADDFNSDGKPDILWRNTTTGKNVIWYMNGATKSGYAYIAANTDQAWKIVGTGDFNSDGKPDILWRNTTTGKNVIWYMNGATKSGYAYIAANTDQSWKIVGTGDFNSDGKTDIVWRNTTTGKNVVWYMNGAVKTGYAFLRDVTDTNWNIVSTGDYNSDGKTDIVWRNTSTGQNLLWYMNGVVRASYAYTRTVTDTAWEIVGK